MSKLLAAAAAVANGAVPTQQVLKIAKIRRDGGTQPREGMSEDVVSDYTHALNAGEQLPAVEICFDGESYWLWDGFHRIEAHSRCGITEIVAMVRNGTLDDARWLSYSANKKHGLRRSASDKRRAIEAALRHPNGVTMSDRQISEHVGVDHKTVGDVRRSMQSTGEIPQLDERTGRDGKTRNTASISQSNRDRAAIPASTGKIPQLTLGVTLAEKIQRLEYWLLGKGWSGKSSPGSPREIEKMIDGKRVSFSLSRLDMNECLANLQQAEKHERILMTKRTSNVSMAAMIERQTEIAYAARERENEQKSQISTVTTISTPVRLLPSIHTAERMARVLASTIDDLPVVETLTGRGDLAYAALVALSALKLELEGGT